jgi:hypothetical protein
MMNTDQHPEEKLGPVHALPLNLPIEKEKHQNQTWFNALLNKGKEKLSKLWRQAN